MSEFGGRIRSIREKAKLFMSDAAQAMGISLVHYSDMERGRRQPPLGDSLRKLAHFLNVDPVEIETWAHMARRRVELDIANKPSPIIEAALLLAEKWDSITENQAREIMRSLSGQI